jgi:hypothetical protein
VDYESFIRNLRDRVDEVLNRHAVSGAVYTFLGVVCGLDLAGVGG